MATKTLPHPQTCRQTAGMQRRHFELIAEVIAKELEGEHREKAAYAFAYILPITNGNFDSQRFLKACACLTRGLSPLAVGPPHS